MRVLVVSYVDCITDEIVLCIRKFDSNVIIDKVKDVWSAKHYLRTKEKYDVIVIDMMVQEDYNMLIDPILQPALNFISLREYDKFNFPNKLFALFDYDETGDKGKDEVYKAGFELANFNFMSLEWRNKLMQYLSN